MFAEEFCDELNRSADDKNADKAGFVSVDSNSVNFEESGSEYNQNVGNASEV